MKLENQSDKLSSQRSCRLKDALYVSAQEVEEQRTGDRNPYSALNKMSEANVDHISQNLSRNDRHG